MRATKKALAPYVAGVYGQLGGNASALRPGAGDGDDAWSHEYAAGSGSGYGWNANLPRLVEAKAKFDPTNLFANTDNVKPP